MVFLKALSDDTVKTFKEQHQGVYIQVPMYVALEWDPPMRQKLLFDARVMVGTVEGQALQLACYQMSATYRFN